MNEYYRTKRMVGATKAGKNKYWEGAAFFVLQDDLMGTTMDVFYETYSWIGEDGKRKSSGMVKVTKKNVGKANETSEKEQAISELESALRKKIDEGYDYEDGTPIGFERYPLPMLAKVYTVGDKLDYPVFLQYKYNGFRCFHNGSRFWSRKNKEYVTCPHLTVDTGGVVIDGELMLPSPYTFQQGTSAIKREQELSKQLVYILYDLYDEKNPDMPFHERYERLKSFVLPPQVTIAPTETANSEEDIAAFHKRANDLGYEGTMIRNPNGLYLAGLKRSDDLIKFKNFMDDEFEITGFTEGNGQECGAIIFICKTKLGKTFSVRPAETYEERRKMFLEGDKYIGKMYTVKFQGYTDEGTPYFQSGVSIRDYE